MKDNEMDSQKITIEAIVNKPIADVWEKWTLPQHIMAWNSASDDWYTPSAVNDLKIGGHFNSKMSARDGSASFDFGGTYDEVIYGKKIAYTLGDGRKVVIEFSQADGGVKVRETFDTEDTYSVEWQRSGWQSILDHFRKYTESL